eukprot:TRINITY_DN10829_c0_g4_i3.p1 TRINITY_DN10829_c0_g4~~TRINITY_DN10829_c0_g4_i3.p1  ORF type:complete len:768 (+),score=206.32 TRINITY_DN10829_c0_g4_i3:53-2356(+)
MAPKAKPAASPTKKPKPKDGEVSPKKPKAKDGEKPKKPKPKDGEVSPKKAKPKDGEKPKKPKADGEKPKDGEKSPKAKKDGAKKTDAKEKKDKDAKKPKKEKEEADAEPPPPDLGPGFLPHDLPFYALPASPVGRPVRPDIPVTLTPGGRLPQACSPHPPAVREEYRRRLVAFYEAHNPDKLVSVDNILDAWCGEEAALFASLEERYAAKPKQPPQSPGAQSDVQPPALNLSLYSESNTGWMGGVQLVPPNVPAAELNLRRQQERERRRADERLRLAAACKLSDAVKELKELRTKEQARKRGLELADRERQRELIIVEHTLAERRAVREEQIRSSSPDAVAPQPPDPAAVRARAERLLQLVDPVASPPRSGAHGWSEDTPNVRSAPTSALRSSRHGTPALAIPSVPGSPGPRSPPVAPAELAQSIGWGSTSWQSPRFDSAGATPYARAGGSPRRLATSGSVSPQQSPRASAWPARFEPVAEVLEQAGLGRYCALLAAEDFDLRSFARVTDADLRDLGITALGARKRILSEVDWLRLQGVHADGRKPSRPADAPRASCSVSPRDEQRARIDAMEAIDKRTPLLSPGSAGSRPVDPDIGFHRDTLLEFYKHFDPVKVPQVDAILIEYSGKLYELYAAIAEIYGLPDNQYQLRVAEVLRAKSPGRDLTAPLLCALCNGREAELLEHLMNDGATPPGNSSGWAVLSDAGRPYYVSLTAKESQWELPDALVGAEVSSAAAPSVELSSPLPARWHSPGPPNPCSPWRQRVPAG